MSQFIQPEEWSILLNAMADDELTETQERRFAELLQDDPEFRTEYVRYCQLLTQLRWQYDSEPEEFASSKKQVSPTRSVKPTRRWWPASLVVAMLLMVVIGWLSWNGLAEDMPGTLVNVSGRVEIIRNKQLALLISSEAIGSHPQPLQPGDHVQTGRASSATLLLADQTRIRIQPETEVVVNPRSSGGIHVPSGSINAKVTPQSSRNPLTFFLPNSEVQVLGTELELLSTPERSEVAVLEGKVQVTRNADRTKQSVTAGQFLPVTETAPLSIVEWPLPAEEWSVDFESGLPVGWQGKRVRNSLPKNSRGAVRSVSVLQDQQMVQKIQ
ncbi:MAG: FecR domain-containing protein, partial [Planctomycetaceae bacterium]|nr:FecR domain-containing protein [Planctomycetaceae bacterium]